MLSLETFDPRDRGDHLIDAVADKAGGSLGDDFRNRPPIPSNDRCSGPHGFKGHPVEGFVPGDGKQGRAGIS